MNYLGMPHLHPFDDSLLKNKKDRTIDVIQGLVQGKAAKAMLPTISSGVFRAQLSNSLVGSLEGQTYAVT